MSAQVPFHQGTPRSPLREQVADALAYNDACGPGPVSREEYLDDADVLIALITEGLACDDAAVERLAVRAWAKEMRHTDHPDSERVARRRWDSVGEKVRESWREQARELLRAAIGETP